MIHVMHMNKSSQIYEWVTPHIRISHVKYMDQSCHICSHESCLCDSCHVTYLHSHVTYVHMSHVSSHESCLYDMSHVVHMKNAFEEMLGEIVEDLDTFSSPHIVGDSRGSGYCR